MFPCESEPVVNAQACAAYGAASPREEYRVGHMLPALPFRTVATGSATHHVVLLPRNLNPGSVRASGLHARWTPCSTAALNWNSFVHIGMRVR
ncbi:hypothetical protein SAMN05192543_110218 [Paraburkholderia megapolitana]|uniref:Uncharacterized protein n=1 Tax=Paraburkholderia megapolitana TaxID=420953 RepID=A0A1I3TY21_9BURK|nr:hypothetical protein SAMN05192543_110218 [Paraburkholderia megapolitana]